MHDDHPAPNANCPNSAAEIVATTGALLVVLDRRGRIVAFNPACERLTGYHVPIRHPAMIASLIDGDGEEEMCP